MVGQLSTTGSKVDGIGGKRKNMQYPEIISLTEMCVSMVVKGINFLREKL